jgi:hypothetical protein
MPYVARNSQDEIESLHRTPADGAVEFLPDDHPDVRAFLRLEPRLTNDFVRLDTAFVRVIEDLVETLVAKNVIAFDDLPPSARAKLFGRRNFRERLTRHAMRTPPDAPYPLHTGDTDFGEFL